MKPFASAFGPRGIRVNGVAPGVTDTEMSSFAKTEAGRSFILGIQALQRIAEPADIGPVVAFLVSDDARWITGTTIHVDGGSKLLNQRHIPMGWRWAAAGGKRSDPASCNRNR